MLTLTGVVSCSEYQELLRKGTLSDKTVAAASYYREGDYKKALRLYQTIAPMYRGKANAERILFLEADTYYNLEDYYFATYKFDKFIAAFPNSTNRLQAQFKSAHALFKLSLRASLDQKQTYEALGKLQSFINDNPDSEFTVEANKCVDILQAKLEKKYYDIAKSYHHRQRYKAAIKAFDNYILDYPGSKYTEQALFYKLESAYILAIYSVDELVVERLKIAQDYKNKYANFAKDELLIKKASKIEQDIINRLKESTN